ncbi:MAG: hypothetical protein PXY39_02925 [archaeon]|nr:hypothetical protein [archaeon]
MTEETVKSAGFIESYRQEILNAINTSEDWAESIATTLVSVAAGPGKKAWTKVGDMNLNVWFMNIGASGIAHKSTPLKYFATPIIESFGSRINTELFYPERFSTEGMISHLVKNPEGCYIRDEFTSAFKDMGKDYIADYTEVMSECYDGRVTRRATRKTALEKVHAYMTFLAATTPYIFKVMDESFYTQGTGNRIEYIFDMRLTVEHESPESYFGKRPYQLQAERNQLIDKFSNYMLKIRSSKITNIIPDIEAGTILLTYKEEVENEMVKRYRINPYDTHPSYMARLFEHALKLTCLHSLSAHCANIDMSPNDEHIAMTEDANWAVAKVKRHFEYFKLIMEWWRIHPVTFVAKTIDNQIAPIIDLLSRKEEGIGWSDLRHQFRWEGHTWRDVLEYLFEAKRVYFFEKGSGTHKAMGLTLVENKAKAEGNELTWEFVKLKSHLW